MDEDFDEECQERMREMELRLDAAFKQIKCVYRKVKDLEASRNQPPSNGMTEKRISMMRDILKAAPGREARLKDMRCKLGLRPDQMSKLVSVLDQREFDISRRANRRNEKVIRLRREEGERI